MDIKRIHLTALLLFWIKAGAILITGLAGAILAIWFFGPSTVEFEGIEFKIGLVPGCSGVTELHFAPLGVVEANTHKGPVKLIISLEQIKSDSFKTHIDNPPEQGQLVRQLQITARNKIAILAVRQVAAAFLGSFLVILLIWRLKPFKALLYPLAATLIIGLILVGSFRSYDTGAFREPEYKGVLSLAPAAVKFAGDSLSGLEEIRNHTRQIVSNLGLLFSSVDSLMVMANPEEQDEVVTVLLTSDLHSNPLGVELTKSLAERFKADFVINAGDLTDMGTKAEAAALADLAEIGIPQLFIAGNHDSPETIEFIAGLPQSRVLDGEMSLIKGIKVLGFADPLADGSNVQYESEAKEEEALNQQATRINEAIAAQGRPDILVVHDCKLALRLTDLSSLIVAGHDHQIRMEQGEGWVFINPGTTGASGLRGFYSEEGISYSASIVYIIPDSGLVAVDMVKYNPITKQFSLERKLIDSPTERSAIADGE